MASPSDEELDAALLHRAQTRQRGQTSCHSPNSTSGGTEIHRDYSDNDDDGWGAVQASLLHQSNMICQLQDEADDFRSATASLTETASESRPGECELHQSPKQEPETGSPGQSRVPPTRNLRTTCWWARLLKSHSRALGLEEPPSPQDSCSSSDSFSDTSRKITIVSGCTGSFSEAEVLKVS